MALWCGQATGQLVGGGPFSPRVRLAGELGPRAARERAQRRLEAFVAAEAGRRLKPLRALKTAVGEGRIRGLARGIAYRLVEAGGVIDRRPIEADVKALSQAERRALRALGVRFGAFSVFLPALLEPEALAFSSAFSRLGAPNWAAVPKRLTALPNPPPPATSLSGLGLRAVGGLAAPVEALERLGDALRAAPRERGGARLSDEAIETLGWTRAEVEQLLRALGYRRLGKGPGAPAWRRPATAAPKTTGAEKPRPSPFAALAALNPRPPRAKRRRRPRRAAS